MQWALAILTVVAYVTLPLGSTSFEQQALPTLLVGLAYSVLAILGFRFVLQDLARTTDVSTAQWAAKVLEYPIDDLALSGATWPWTATLRPVGLAVLGVLVALGVFAMVRGGVRGRRRREEAARTGAAGEA